MSVERWTLKTQTGNPALIKLIRSEIHQHGPVSFAWFMQQALYHPEHGYYSCGRCAIGRHGDYFTNVSVGPLFGRLLAAQFAEIWERLGKIDNFVIVEQGAHDGQFARDILESAQERAPELFAVLRYRIVEPFPILQERQRQVLESYRDKVEWNDGIEPFTGVHFSNELLDAMPVRLIGGEMEKFVDCDGESFVFVERPLTESLKCNQAALDWVENVAAKLQRGYVLTIDYGHAQRESRAAVQVRAQHRHLESPFEQIGCADIATYVDWTSIAQRAQANGLSLAGFTDQHHFLAGIISKWPDLTRDGVAKTKRQLQTLLQPEMLGRSFQVLALAKRIGSRTSLAGFKFARDLRVSLGI